MASAASLALTPAAPEAVAAEQACSPTTTRPPAGVLTSALADNVMEVALVLKAQSFQVTARLMERRASHLCSSPEWSPPWNALSWRAGASPCSSLQTFGALTSWPALSTSDLGVRDLLQDRRRDALSIRALRHDHRSRRLQLLGAPLRRGVCRVQTVRALQPNSTCSSQARRHRRHRCRRRRASCCRRSRHRHRRRSCCPRCRARAASTPSTPARAHGHRPRPCVACSARTITTAARPGVRTPSARALMCLQHVPHACSVHTARAARACSPAALALQCAVVSPARR